MADVDIDPFEENKSRPDEMTNETFPLTSRGGAFVTQVQVHSASGKREMSFGGESH